MPRFKPISVANAERAIYIDFEGTATDPPSFLGALWAEGNDLAFVQYVIEEALWPAARAKAPEHGGFCEPATVAIVAAIRRRAEVENRRVFAWSTHERDVLAELAPGVEDGRWFAGEVENAIPMARGWKGRVFPHVVFEKSKHGMGGRHRLHRYFELIGYPVDKAFGPGNSAQRIRYVRKMLESRGGDYSGLTPTAKAKWTKALQHNWHDCNGLREVVLRCAADLTEDVTTGSEPSSDGTALPGGGSGSA